MSEGEQMQRQLQELQNKILELTTNQQGNYPVPHVASVSVKLSPFWPNIPVIWFAQAEVQFEIAGITKDATKYGHILAMLDPSIADEVEDVLTNPPSDNKYEKKDDEYRLR